jgi:hypothetical protein
VTSEPDVFVDPLPGPRPLRPAAPQGSGDEARHASGPLRPLRRLPWSDTAREVWLPLWRQEVASGASIPRFSPQALPALLSDLDSVAKQTRSGVRVLSPEAERRAAVRALALHLAVALADAGCEPGVGAGMRLVLRRGDAEVAPLEVVQELKDGRVTPEAWTRTCEALGV